MRGQALPVALGGMAALAVAMGIGRFAFTPLLPMMQRDWGLSLTNGGWLASANYAGYFFGALSAVWLRKPPQVMIRSGLLLTALLTLAMGLTHSLPFWLLLRGLGGVASAWVMVYVAAWALPQLVRWGRPGWSGLVFSGVGAGIALTGGVCYVLAVRYFSSHTIWMLLGGLALIAALFVWSVTARELADAPVETALEATPQHWSPDTRKLVLCYGVFGFGYIIPATFLPVIARRTIHEPSAVGLLWPLFGLAAFGSTFLASSLANRYSDRRLLSVVYGLQALGVTALALSPTVAGAALCALLVGGTFMVITMFGLREARRLGGADASRLMGAMTAAFAIGQIIGPLYASLLVRLFGSFVWSLATAAVLMAASAAMLSSKAAALEV